MRLPLILALALALIAPTGAQAATKKATKKSCPPGLLPVLKGKKVQRDGKGRLKCAVPKRPAAKVLPRPLAPTPTAQLGVVADQLDSVIAVHPGALKNLERKIGAKRAKKLVAIATDSWRKRAVVARASVRAHAAETKSESYAPVKGAEVKFTGEFKTVDDGTVAGYQGRRASRAPLTGARSTSWPARPTSSSRPGSTRGASSSTSSSPTCHRHAPTAPAR